MNEQELYHYGVPGMKWGKQNGPPYPLNAEGKKALSKQREEEKKAKREDKEIKRDRKKASKNRRRLSDEELDERIKRLEKEKKLKDLTDDDVNRGKKKVKEFFSSTAGKALKATAYAGMAAGVVAIARSKGFKNLVNKLPYTRQVKEVLKTQMGVNMTWDEFIKDYLIPAVKPKKK